MERVNVDELGLNDHQRKVCDRVLAEENARRDHVVVYLSGAHAYGFPSPDSDLDLKAIHVGRTSALVGLSPPQPTVDRAEIVDGVEIDYTSNELAHALAGILLGNGNFIERVLGRTVASGSPFLEELRPLVRASLSRRVHRHYSGFARNQLAELEKTPTVKKLLYVLRTATTGTHLLRTGELETDLTRLVGEYGLEGADDLVLAKRAGERTAVDPSVLEAWRSRIASLFEGLDRARDASVLPDEPPRIDAIEAWLVGVRRAHF